MPYTIENGIKTNSSKVVATKIAQLLQAEKCTVKESHDILSLVADIVNNSTVTVQAPSALDLGSAVRGAVLSAVDK